ncbi:DUF2851 family protein [Ulvibacterium sp.]|uniref:DUF2851 family protein n=1 Tax=Ulvibacterium sp. TaxID=2665914 RepID=UPI002635146E|nr:DUF2851 family protein [Ulvibacterium sp.]
MREDLLHFIWKYRKLPLKGLVTSNGQKIEIFEVGIHNHFAGPDFFNAKIRLEGQLWAGNVEIHVKASDWYAHGHEKDANYNAVILHVVWEDDVAVFRGDASEIPTLELKRHIPDYLLSNYQNLFDKRHKRFINCEKSIGEIDLFVFRNWLDRLYFERLEGKSMRLQNLLKESKNNWEQVLFNALLKNFGSKINGESFSSLGGALDFSIIRKIQNDSFKLESVFFGLMGLLTNHSIKDIYYINMSKEYGYIKAKYQLDDRGIRQPEFFKLRPANFPTIRLSQLANLYSVHPNLFSEVIEAASTTELYSIFTVSASSYWDTHFTFGKESRRSTKKLTKAFIDLLIVNTIIPLKFCHAQYTGKEINEEIAMLASQLKREENNIVKNFDDHRIKATNAFESQALLQLYNEYCIKNRCLECAVGTTILNRNN